jgi:Ca2+-binding RTX toxin-like protein
VYTDAPGDGSLVGAFYSGGVFTVSDLDKPINAGTGCLPTADPRTVRCGSTASAITFNMYDNNDFVQVTNTTCRCSGGRGSDTLRGFGGADRLDGGQGDDSLEGGFGPDNMTGGDGNDTVTYESQLPVQDRNFGVVVTIDDVANDGSVEDDVGGVRDNVHSDIENVDGTHFDDTLTGFATATGARSVLNGADGNDTLAGGNGAPQVLMGGAGADTMLRDPSNPDVMVSYADHAAGVNAFLDGVAHSGNADDGNADRIGANVNWLIGSANADRLTGNSASNTLDGTNGDDVLDGRAGPDSLLGGNGADTADYSRRTTGITATVGGTGGDASDGTGDALLVENITGGRGNDTLVGDGGPNVLDADRGNDTLTGGGANDRLLGRAGADTLDGGLGADDLDGGPDTDTADYSTRTVAVTASLDGQANDGNADDGPTGARDNVRATVENLVGGADSDLLVGSAVGNNLHGGPGNDQLRGLGGNDYLYGGDGDDTLTGGANADFLYGDTGTDTADYPDHTAAQGVTVSLDGVDNDGAPNVDCITYLCPAQPQDNALVENVTGGPGDDTLTGDGLPNRLVGARGADQLFGLDGDDDLEARDNIQDLQLDCGDGTDSVRLDAGLDPAPQDCELILR